MSYKVTILNKKYVLPARTLSVDDSIEEMSKIDAEYGSGNISRRAAVEKMYDFVEQLAPESLPPIEEVDTNDLITACIDIIRVYDEPVRKVRNEAKLSEAREILSKPEVKTLVDAAKAMKK